MIEPDRYQHTVQVSGVENTTGTVLVEVYEAL
jgi:hypothetical protein